MTDEEKQLLLKDLCPRLLYGVKFTLSGNNIYTMTISTPTILIFVGLFLWDWHWKHLMMCIKNSKLLWDK